MKGQWSFYDPTTGVFARRTFSGSERQLAQNTPPGLIPMEGRFDCEAVRVDVALLEVSHGDHSHHRDFVVPRTPDHPDPLRTRLAALRAIGALEREQLRPMRELAIDPHNVAAKERLAKIDHEIAMKRADLTARS